MHEIIALGLYDREFYYGTATSEYADNPRRFAVLVRAALEWASRQTTPISIIHAHDWQAGLAPVYLRSRYASAPSLAGARSLLTIHNLAYQGRFDKSWMPELDLGWDLFGVNGLEFYGGMSFLKGGVTGADIVTTVSPQYAREIQTPEGGVGFDGILRGRADSLFGILNGIDTAQWNPASDPNLPQPYSATDLAGKRAAKAAVLAQIDNLQGELSTAQLQLRNSPGAPRAPPPEPCTAPPRRPSSRIWPARWGRRWPRCCSSCRRP